MGIVLGSQAWVQLRWNWQLSPILSLGLSQALTLPASTEGCVSAPHTLARGTRGQVVSRHPSRHHRTREAYTEGHVGSDGLHTATPRASFGNSSRLGKQLGSSWYKRRSPSWESQGCDSNLELSVGKGIRCMNGVKTDILAESRTTMDLRQALLSPGLPGSYSCPAPATDGHCCSPLASMESALQEAPVSLIWNASSGIDPLLPCGSLCLSKLHSEDFCCAHSQAGPPR